MRRKQILFQKYFSYPSFCFLLLQHPQCLGLLINMVENGESNRKVIMEMVIQVKRGEQLPVKTMKAVHAVVEVSLD